MKIFKKIVDKVFRIPADGSGKPVEMAIETTAPSGMGYVLTKHGRPTLVRIRDQRQLIMKMINDELDRLAWPTCHVHVTRFEDHYRVDVGRGALTWLRAEQVLLVLMKLPSNCGHAEISRKLHKLSQS